MRASARLRPTGPLGHAPRARLRRYLRIVDKFNDQNVFAYVTAGQVKFLLLHEGRNEDAVKAFFAEVHELYTKQLLNPFYTYDTPIVSPVFNARIRALARRYIL